VVAVFIAVELHALAFFICEEEEEEEEEEDETVLFRYLFFLNVNT
jgi:hypothetical protein